MATKLNTAEVKQLLSRYKNLEQSLEKYANLEGEQRKAIENATKDYLSYEAMRILSEVPVDELNRDKDGFRINALKDRGYRSIADILAASVYQLSSIYGISEDSARRIKRKASELQRETLKTVRPRLNTENKDARSTALVKAVAVYMDSRTPAANIRKLYQFEPAKRSQSVAALQPMMSGLSRLFMSRGQKERAEIAYDNLSRLVDGKYGKAVQIVSGKLDAVLGYTNADAWSVFSGRTAAFFITLEEIVPGIFGKGDALFGLPEELARAIQDQDFFPNGLKAELYKYQVMGVKYILHQERVLLGDEMGLGKTVQAIAAMVSLRNTGVTHFLVVCPASVIQNWVREITKHSRLRPIMIYGSSRRQALSTWKKQGGVAVTNYETTDHIELDKAFRFGMLVVDEAHYIKNPEARRSVNVRELCAHTNRLLFMTGTALENKVEEMITLIGVLQPKIAAQASAKAFMATAPQFREMVAPVYYRRKKEDVLDQLPPKQEKEEWCTLGAQEEYIYERSVLERNYAAARQVSWNVDDLRFSSKAKRLLELVEEAQSNGRKILIFTFFLETARKVSELMGGSCVGVINGSVNPNARQRIIDEFDNSPPGSVLVCQIQSGGTGLNIQAASVVIICEPQLKPSIENQAIGRSYRMNQKKPVFVHRLLCTNSVDEKIMDMLAEKQKVFDAFADKSVAASATPQEAVIDNTSMNKIINEEIERIKSKQGNKA